MPRVRIDFPELSLFAHEIPVRVTDLNYGNHLGHDTLVSLLHEARARFFRAHDMQERDVDGVGILLVDLAVRYQAQAFYGQVLRIEIAAGEIGSRGCELLYRVTDRESGRPVATAATGIVFFDYAEQRVAPMPERFRRVLEPPAP
jgi:acyl-CoA thioesterase FadM